MKDKLEQAYDLGKIKGKKEAIEIIKKWYADEKTCSGKPHCCVEECDLCVNCFDDLLNKFKETQEGVMIEGKSYIDYDDAKRIFIKETIADFEKLICKKIRAYPEDTAKILSVKIAIREDLLDGLKKIRK